jgi:hypothetical protein
MIPTSQDQFFAMWVLASLLGLIPAFIAARKGRNFGLWWVYGSMIFIVALFHSLLLKPKAIQSATAEKPAANRPPPLPDGTKHCIFCGQLIDESSVRCPVCKQAQPEAGNYQAAP